MFQLSLCVGYRQNLSRIFISLIVIVEKVRGLWQMEYSFSKPLHKPFWQTCFSLNKKRESKVLSLCLPIQLTAAALTNPLTKQLLGGLPQVMLFERLSCPPPPPPWSLCSVSKPIVSVPGPTQEKGKGFP